MYFFVVSFVVDMAQRSHVELLFPCLNGADSHAKLQLVIFEF